MDFKKLTISYLNYINNVGVYIQVAYLLSDEKVIKREFGNLEKIKDNYKKYVISLDTFQFDNKAGIEHLSLLNFVLMKSL